MLQASSLALIGMLTVVGCGGSDTTTPVRKDGGLDTGGGGGGGGGVVKVDKAVLDFGSIDIGSTSTAQTVTVQVSGAATAINATVTGSGFAISGTTCAPVQAIGSCTISVKFAPASIGAATGTLAVGNAAVALSGAGQNPGTFSVTDRVDLGTLLVGATSSAVVQVVPSPSVTGLTCVPSGSNLTLASQTCAATGAIAAPCTFTFTFKAATAGVKSDAVVCTAGTTVKQTTVAAVVVTPAALTINPPTAAFTASVGGTYVATFNVSNSGGSPTGNLSATISAGATDFAITSNDCVVPLASLAICKIQVTFKPASVGAKTGTLTVADATVGTVPATAALTGTAIAATNLVITPATSDFGTVDSTATKTTNFTIKNTGGTASDAIVIGGGSTEFIVDAALCNNLPLAPNASCAFTVTFKPASAGAKTAAIIATVNGVASATAQVTGTGKVTGLPVLTVDPPTLDFGTIGVDTTKGPLSLTVKNTGGSATGVLSVVKKDSTSSVGGASQFTFTSPDCNGATLDAGESCTVAVTYSPTIIGSASAVLTISDGSVSSANGTVIGIALSIPTLTVLCPTTAIATFDSTVVGQTSANVVCTVKNDTTVNTSNQAPQESGAITATPTGDFAIATNNCTASLQPKESCTLIMVFKPTAKGARTGKLSISSANKGISEADLKGTGWLPLQVDAYYTSPTGKFTKLTGAYDFGNVPMGSSGVAVGVSSLTLAVYVHANVGNFAISGTDLNFSNANALADFAGSPVDALTTLEGIGKSAKACASLTNTSNPPFSDDPYCFVTVDFTPKSKGAKTNGVTVAGANGTASDSVNMQGTGTGPLTINPSPLTFDAVAVGTSGVQILTLTVKNSASSVGSNATIKIDGTNAADFSIVEDLISNKELPANNTVIVPIRLTVPAGAAVGALSATVTVTAVIAGVTETTTANLVGSAVTGAGISAALASGFADTVVTGTSAPVKVTVKNNGSLATDKLNIKLSGGDDFSVKLAATQTSSCGDLTSNTLNNLTDYKLDPGASCDFNVWFTPKAGLGVSKRVGTLTVSSKIGGMQILALAGNATGLLTITPAPQDLGTWKVGEQHPTAKTFTITNNGGKPVSFGSGAISIFNDKTLGQTGSTEIAIKTHTCTTIGAAGSSSPLPYCTVDVWMITQDGALPGQRAATLKVDGTVESAQAGTATAIVTGTAALPATLKFTPVDAQIVNKSASTVDRDFGTVVLGQSSAPQTFVVTNIGGFDSSPLSFYFYDIDDAGKATTTAHTKPAELKKDGTTCTGDGAVVKAGQSCKIVVAFSPTRCASPYPTDCGYTTVKLGGSTAQNGVWLAVSATNGTDGETDTANNKQAKFLYGPKLYGNAIETNIPNIVAASTGLATYDFGSVAAPAGDTNLTLTSLFSLTNSSLTAITLSSDPAISVADAHSLTGSGASNTVASVASEFTSVAAPAGTTGACHVDAGNKVLAAGESCVFGIKWTVTKTSVAGTREVKVTVLNTSEGVVADINIFGRVSTKASLVVLPYPLASVTSTPLDFGTPAQGVDSLVQTVTIMNVGELATTALKVVDLKTTISGQVKVMDSTTCQGTGSALASLGTCKLALSVHPADTDKVDPPAEVKYIALASDTAATPASLMKVGPVVATWDAVDSATLTPNPTSLAFDVEGAAYPGTGVLADTTAQTITITNSGTPITGPLSISLSSADFYIDRDTANSSCLKSELALSGLGASPATATSCTLKIFFSPAALATPAKTGTLTVSAPYAPTTTVQLSGTAIPALKVAQSGGTVGTFTGTTSSAAAVQTFPAVTISSTTTYLEQTFAFTKAHGAPATGLLSTSISGASAAEFKIVDDKCIGVSLSDSLTHAQDTAVCTVTVRFAPTSAGTGKVATLTVTDPLSGTPADTISVDLKGSANP